MTVRQGHRLVGLAPFYLRRRRLGGRVACTCLQALGTGGNERLTEIPQILVAPSAGRRVLRQLIAALAQRAERWDWAEIPLTPEQGWFEPHWVPLRGNGPVFALFHKATRPFVVATLPSSWDTFRGALKRNVKESVRRGVNRLDHAGFHWEVVTAEQAGGFDAALDELILLHRARARVHEREPHRDEFEEPSVLPFAKDAAARMFSAGLAEPVLLRVDGCTAAARLLLEANGSVFFSVSGLEPRFWQFSPTTVLKCGEGNTLSRRAALYALVLGRRASVPSPGRCAGRACSGVARREGSSIRARATPA